MRKILLAVDALKIHQPSLDFACFMASLSKSPLTGVFLENVLEQDYAGQSPAYADDVIPDNHWRELVDRNIQSFKNICEERGVRVRVNRDRGLPANELISESRFADLLIVQADLSFRKKYDGSPSEFVKKILSDAKCPVLISPEDFEGIREIVFAYDGSDSSLFAIKQFSYLFPELSDRKVSLIEVNKNDEPVIKHKPQIGDWVKTYYPEIRFTVLHGHVEEELFKYFVEKKNSLIVMGAYGRNMLSTFFRESHAEQVMEAKNLAVFISHYG